MKNDTLEYIKARANDEGSIKAVSCADVRDLLAERAELLEALKISLHRADQARYHTAENIEPITAEWLGGIIEAARAAIAKAEGR